MHSLRSADIVSAYFSLFFLIEYYSIIKKNHPENTVARTIPMIGHQTIQCIVLLIVLAHQTMIDHCL